MTNREMLEMLCRDMGEVKVSVHNLEEDVAVLKEDAANLKEDVESLKLTQENELRKNIMTIADGHMDLNRKLDEALKVSQERERTILRVTVLENDMRIVKNQLGITA